jgi:FMN phosphatase YigB (HAD superfamily)
MGFFGKGIPKKTIIVFDMDNTLVDEFGATVRPGMLQLLKTLKVDYRLFLWTNSMRNRAVGILSEHGLGQLFEKCIFREDYDPENKGLSKDLRTIAGKFIVDDDPAEIEFNRKNGIAGHHIVPYRKHMQGTDDGAAAAVLRAIRGK